MPHLDALAWSLWGLTIGVQIALAVQLFVCGCWPRWKAVCTFVVFNAASSLVLLAAMLNLFGYDNAPAIYFYGYWIKEAINAGLQLWLIAEVACNVAPAVTKVLTPAIFLLAGLFTVGALFLSGSSHLPFVAYSSKLVVTLDRATSLAWLALFVCLTYLSDALGIKWRRQELGAGIGLTLILINETMTGWLMGEFPAMKHWKWISDAREIWWVIAFGVWAINFSRKPTEPDAEHADLLPLAEALKQALKYLMRSKP